MKIWIVLAPLAIGCWGSSSPEPAAPIAAQPELRCKTVVEQASAAIPLKDNDVTMAIGECEQREWSQKARQCVAAAHTSEVLAACGTTYALGTRGIFRRMASFNAAMRAMEHFRDEMCACTDTACAQATSDEMAKWSQDQARDDVDMPKLTDEQMKRATTLGEEMGKCMQKAMSATTPSP